MAGQIQWHPTPPEVVSRVRVSVFWEWAPHHICPSFLLLSSLLSPLSLYRRGLYYRLFPIFVTHTFNINFSNLFLKFLKLLYFTSTFRYFWWRDTLCTYCKHGKFYVILEIFKSNTNFNVSISNLNPQLNRKSIRYYYYIDAGCYCF